MACCPGLKLMLLVYLAKQRSLSVCRFVTQFQPTKRKFENSACEFDLLEIRRESIQPLTKVGGLSSQLFFFFYIYYGVRRFILLPALTNQEMAFPPQTMT